MSTNVAVVTGGNKGIGFEIVKGLCQRFNGKVYLGSRDEMRGRKAVKQLQDIGLDPELLVIDVDREDSVKQAAEILSTLHSGIDVLVNNAGILDFEKPVPDYEHCKRVINTNFRSLLLIQRHFYPLLKDTARIINMSSDWGLLSNIRKQVWLDKFSEPNYNLEDIVGFVEDFLEASKVGKSSFTSFAGPFSDYKVSKVALSALTFLHQREFIAAGKDISINCVHPGFVKTDMTKGMGDFCPERGAKAPLYLALEAPQQLKGSFVWHDCNRVNWDD